MHRSRIRSYYEQLSLFITILTNLTSLKLIVFRIYSSSSRLSFKRTRLYIILILYTTIRFVPYLVASQVNRGCALFSRCAELYLCLASNFLLITRILCWVRRVDVTKVSHGTRPLDIFRRSLGDNFVARKVKCRGWRTTVPETLCRGS